jgi:type I restriction enzyme M protein
MTAPTPTDTICDPACGTCGFLVAAGEYLRDTHPSVMTDAAQRQHFNHAMFHGYDFDNTMLRIGSMNMLLHGVDNPDIRYRDSPLRGHASDEGRYSPGPRQPSLRRQPRLRVDAKGLLKDVKTKKTELLFLALFLRLLKPGGRAAVIVPDGVLFGSSPRTRRCAGGWSRSTKLDAVVKLPLGAFRPYAGVSTAILFFTRTNSGGTEDVWFYDIQADGWSLDDKGHLCLQKTNSAVCRPLTSPPTSTSRTTSPMCWVDGLLAQRNPNARARSRASSCRRPTSSPRDMTYR